MKNCLVVDDSSVIRKVARRILEGLQFQISEAEDGEHDRAEVAAETSRRVLELLRPGLAGKPELPRLVDEALAAAKREADPAKRADLLRQALTAVHGE